MTDWFQHTVSFNVQLSPEQKEQFSLFESLLLDWNSRMNLTAVRDAEGIRIRHFLDSLSGGLIPHIRTSELSLIDVGTGGGFPGLPLKIAFPNLKLTLTDSVTRKTRFLEAVVQELGLKNVAVLAERAEDLGQNPLHREQYDIALARSVAFMPVLLEYLLPLTKVGGRTICFKGDNAPHETAEGKYAASVLGGQHAQTIDIQLVDHELKHHLVIFDKLTQTPQAYPRRPGRPLKKPLVLK